MEPSSVHPAADDSLSGLRPAPLSEPHASEGSAPPVQPTPGPWVWHKHNDETWRIYGTADMRDGPAEGCYVVADVINGNGSPQNAANRDLLVAAPLLLEACRAIVEWDDAENNAQPFDDDKGAGFYRRIALCNYAMTSARAALAKSGISQQ